MNQTPTARKKKLQQSIVQQYKDDPDYEQSINESNTSDSAFIPLKVDELSRYLSTNINKTILIYNPLESVKFLSWLYLN